MLPELWSAMNGSMPDGGRCRYFGVGEKSSDAYDRFPLAGNGYCLAKQRGFARISCVEFAVFFPDQLSHAREQHSVRNDPTRYNPNLSEEEPLFNASTFNSG